MNYYAIINWLIILFVIFYVYGVLIKRFKGGKKMGILKDAFSEIIPKKKPSTTNEVEELKKLQAEVNKKLEEAENSQQKTEELPKMAITTDNRLDILEHNLNVIINDIHERISNIEQFLLNKEEKKEN